MKLFILCIASVIALALSGYVAVATAESVWTEDGSLVITDSPTDVYIKNGRVQYEVEVSEDESTFIYGKNELTVCMPTQDGSICY